MICVIQEGCNVPLACSTCRPALKYLTQTSLMATCTQIELGHRMMTLLVIVTYNYSQENWNHIVSLNQLDSHGQGHK